jgi:hypothetical protein
MPGMGIAVLVPEVDGFLPLFFLGLLGLLTAAVGAFSVFLIVQQFRNPGRRPPRPH